LLPAQARREVFLMSDSDETGEVMAEDVEEETEELLVEEISIDGMCGVY
jgi:mycofactocin precursor